MEVLHADGQFAKFCWLESCAFSHLPLVLHFCILLLPLAPQKVTGSVEFAPFSVLATYGCWLPFSAPAGVEKGLGDDEGE